jgi:DNA invertase Pin-like site-specific DNA recombinase
MNKAVVFTRQRGDCADKNEQQVLAEPVRTIEEYADRMQLQTVYCVSETGISAHDLFCKMIDYLRDHPEVHSVITYSLDRIVRSAYDRATLFALTAKQNITLYTVCDQCVTSYSKHSRSSEDTLHKIRAAIEKNYRDTLSER